MHNFKTLDSVNNRVIYDSFIEAFSDYQIKLSLDYESFQDINRRRGLSTEISVAAFNDTKIIGLILNGLRDWQGKLTCYDMGTGVLSEYRRRGVTSQMFHFVLSELKKKHVQQYLLEVLQENTAAIELYKKEGFQVTREFVCWKLDAIHLERKSKAELIYVESFDETDWYFAEKFWDYNPSWQNSRDSIEAVKEKFVYCKAYINQEFVGYGILDKTNGDFPQLAVHSKYRHQGIGKDIVSSFFKHTSLQHFKMINVDKDCLEMQSFLTDLHATILIMQFEMIKEII